MSNNLGLNLRQRAELSPEAEAYLEPSTNTRLTYGELNAFCNRCAAVMAGLNCKPGDRVALLTQNSKEFVGLYYAAAKLGLVAVPLNTRLAAAELSFILADSGARTLFYSAECTETTQAIKVHQAYTLDVESYVQINATDGEDLNFDQLMATATSDEPEVTHGGSDDLFIMYTSGTTGQPKGVVHTHESISYSSLSWATTMDVRYLDRLLLPLPMFHVAALTCVSMCCLRGLTIVSMPNFDPMTIWSVTERERVNIAAAVPAILNFMRQAPGFKAFDSPDFRYFVTGAAPVPKSLIELYNSQGMEVMQGYALTETGGGGSFLLNEDAIPMAGSAGKPGMFTTICLRDDDANLVQVGVGEVLIRGPFLMREYWNRPQATEEAFDRGWFRTGDVAEIDKAGFIWIKDRIKDMIISGGENIYPAEIENVIISHPSVTEVAVIGLPDEKWGELVCAVVVADADEGLEEAVMSLCADKLSRYKLPRRIEYVDILPRNAAGKVLKRELRDRFG